MAQLSFADLIVRRVPLTAAEAASLTLAAAEQGPVPDVCEISLSSTGVVTFSSPAAATADEAVRLASLLHQLLRLDEPDGDERRWRIPGGLLVVLARTMRQMDLPALNATDFKEALVRFGARREPGMLAAIFWRAARMRGPNRPRAAASSASPATSRRRAERRSQGPAPAELRRWLRQTEREVFQLRRSRAAAASAAIIASFVVVVSVAIGLDLSDSSATARASTDLPLEAQPISQAVDRELPAPRTAVNPLPKRATAERVRTASRSASSSSASSSPARRTVQMVNLPRASWAVVRTR